MFFKNYMSDVIELDCLEEIGDDLVLGLGSATDDDVSIVTSKPNIQLSQLGGRVLWNDPVVMTPSASCVVHSGHIIKTPDRLRYAPAVELRYLGKMAELDHAELAAMYVALWSMELALIWAGVGRAIKHTSELKVLNYKKATRSPEAEE